tara:strand:+ start:81 stop:467 length:387 start_codon:yes stop_codon:yes gene_type:complete
MMLGKNQLVNMSLPVLSSVDYGQMSPMRILHARLTARRWCANKSQSAVIVKKLEILKRNRLAEEQPSIIRIGWLGYGHNYSVPVEFTQAELDSINKLIGKDNKKMKKHKKTADEPILYQNEMKIDSLD